ncbi:trypsin-like peptidase domain-containing protein [Siccirubricoccus deserti]|uniref:Trypsin-like peptidase domain-containing protein n=2 Tax=Siccirubricoccus deserti TaxID=2013562 RepID=A0A9X0R3M0_9PROT|nr:trypsin-like peptidase domain-containing protein [Siccirubricoccus deserti]
MRTAWLACKFPDVPPTGVMPGRPSGANISGSPARRTVVASAPGTDRCVLHTADATLTPVRGIRRYGEIDVGERAFTLAAPSGLELTLGDGLVSSLRSVRGIQVVQTSAPMSPGSSGGALLDAKGNLIGILAFDVRGVQSLGFALAAEGFWTLR